MRTVFFTIFLLITTVLSAQQKIVRTIQSDAPYIDVYVEGIDNLKIEESDTNSIEITLFDKNELGVFESFSCEDKTCVLKVKAVIKQSHAINDKIHQFPLAPPSNVTATIKIPKGKTVSIIGEMIDIQSKGYQGSLKILIDKGDIRLPSVKGIVELQVFSGAIYATIEKEASLEIQTRKGTISLDKKVLKSPFKKEQKGEKQLIVKSMNANVVLTSKKT